MNIIAIIVDIGALIYLVNYFYDVWIQPDKYINKSQKNRKGWRSRVPFISQVLFYGFFNEHPGLEVFLVRTISVILFIFWVLSMIAAIHGPFG
jgi:hypothetical protein